MITRPPAYPSRNFRASHIAIRRTIKRAHVFKHLTRERLYAPVTTIDAIISRYRSGVRENRRRFRYGYPARNAVYKLLLRFANGGLFFRHACGLVAVLTPVWTAFTKRSVYEYKDSDVRPDAYSLLDAHSGCIARPWLRRMLYEACTVGMCASRAPGIPKIFTSSSGWAGGANEKRRPSTSARQDGKEIYKNRS